MTVLSDHFSTDCCMLVLGSVGDTLDRIPAQICQHVRVFFLDAVNETAKAAGVRSELIRGIVAAERGPTKLTVRNFPLCSSVPDIYPRVVEDFGLQDYARPTGEISGNARTIGDIAAEYGVTFDYIKTDIEGLDGPVIMSAGPLLDSALMVTMELRFLPNYFGEPLFDEVVAFMRHRGFEVLRVDVENWLYDVPGRDRDKRGRTVHADSTFVRSPTGLDNSQLVRLVGLLCATGNHNYARYCVAGMPEPLRSTLVQMIDTSRPAPRHVPLWRKLARRIKRSLLRRKPPQWRFEHLDRR